MAKRGKRYDTAIAEIDPELAYDPKEAVSITKRNATAKFDETVELHLKTGADPRHAEQMVRGIALLPHGVGKEIRTLVFCQGDVIQSAKQAGADHVGNDDVIAEIEKGWLDFDVSIATPDMMGKVSKLGRILGRKGLMPNPRTGTVVSAEDIPKAIEEAKKGRVEFRLDKSALIHVPIGKASFDEDQLMENLTTLVDTILRGRPSGVKGQFLRSAFLTSTMGPSVPIDIAGMMSLRVE
ncbi:MAG: large subunit ribosomal protein L1 [Chloroflexi bacterium]|jgi:large subunit ribosomal protein L1|nr:MAG: large subunit ribosomal protein L1 [Chloroflexota bacterium]